MPPRTYDLVVIGGGTAGLTAAVGAAGQGAKTLLIERGHTGGDCLWTGCVPSKALLTVAKRAHAARTASELGVHTNEPRIDVTAAMAHVRQAISTLAPHDSPERLRQEGVEVVQATGRFVGPDRIEVAGRRVRFRHAMLATGAVPVIPPIPGLAEAAPLTSETVWCLTELPERLVVLGGGPIGVELGQAFARLGAHVTLIEIADGLLPREEPRAREVVASSLRADGVDVRVATLAVRVDAPDAGVRRGASNPAAADGGRHRLVVTSEGGEDTIAFDEILVAVGRRPSVAGLGLEDAGVHLDPGGAVRVDDHLRTTNPRVYAGGDVTMLLPFTHTASAHGATVVQNALYGLRRRVDHDRVPWVTFTSPEVARVGPSLEEATRRFGDRVRVHTVDHTALDRAVAAGDTAGFATLIGDPKGRIVGATVVGPRAGEVIGEVVAWMAGGAAIADIVRTTHAYPTWNEDLTAASLAELRLLLRRYRFVTRGVLWLRQRWLDASTSRR